MTKTFGQTFTDPVAQVQNVSCVVFNWMKMNCTWDLGLQPKDISVTFKWNVAGSVDSFSFNSFMSSGRRDG